MGKRWLLLPLVLALLLLALYGSQRRVEPFHVSGFLEADEIRVGSRVGGRVAAVHVEEGARVQPGQVLVELEPYDLLERRAERAAHVERARARLARAEAGFRPEEIAQGRARVEALSARLARLVSGPRKQEIEAARARVEAASAAQELAELEEARTRSLVQDQIRSVEALDRSQALLKAARAEVRSSSEQLALLEEGSRAEEMAEARAELAEAQAALALLEGGERAEDIAAARAELEAEQAALRALERSLEELVIRSPADAVVEALSLQPGDLVAPLAPVVALRDTTTLRVRAYVPQGSLDFTVGASARVTVDAYPDRRFAARITFVAPAAEFTPSNVQTPEERSQQVFRIRATLSEGLDLLRPGVSADVWFGE